MTKWLSIWLLLGVISCSILTTGVPPEDIKVYRLLLGDGQVIAYTEFKPHIGDYYWQSQPNIWYHVVRVEGDIGWLEPASPPEEDPRHPLAGALLFLLIGIFFVYLWRVRGRRQ